MKHEEVIDVANKFTNENLVDLIRIFADRIHIFIGAIEIKKFDGNGRKFLLTAELSKENPVCLNGATIQINTEFTDELREQ